MRNFITPLKSNESSHPRTTSKDQKSNSPPKMFEDDLGDDFLTSWKPTKMDMDVDLDLHKVQGAKSTLKKTFASSKMDMDFDFDGGFSKLSSFDIDISFDSPPSSAKKPKKIDRPKKLRPEDEDNDLAFDLKGFTTLDVEDAKVKDNGKSHQSEPKGSLNMTLESYLPTHQASVSTSIDRSQSENLGRRQTEEERNVTPNVKENPIAAELDARRRDTASPSPFLQPDLALGQHSVQDTGGFVDHEETILPDSELTTTALGWNASPILPTPIGGVVADTCILGSRGRSESDFAENLNPVVDSGTRPSEEPSPRPEVSEPTPNNSRTNFSDQDHVAQDLVHEPMKQQISDKGMTLTGPRSSAILDDKKEAGASLNPKSSETLQFDPLSKSSQNKVGEVALSENFGQPANQSKSRRPERPDTPRTRRVENQHQEIGFHDPDELTVQASGPAMTVPIRDENATGLPSLVQEPVSNTFLRRSSGDLGDKSDTAPRSEVQNVTVMPSKLLPLNVLHRAVADLSLDDSKEMQKEGEEVAIGVKFHQTLTVHGATLGDKGSGTISTHAPVASIKTAEKVRADHVEGKQNNAREDPNFGQLKLKTAPTTATTSTMTFKELKGIPSQKLASSKRPSRELFGTPNKIQSGSKRTSPIYPEDDQGDSGRGTRVRPKKGRRQAAHDNAAGLLKALPPAAGTKQGMQVQSSGINIVRAENQLSSRTLTASKFFPTDGPISANREMKFEIKNQGHSPSPELGKSSRLISSITSQLRTPMQPVTLVGNKTMVRKNAGAPEVSRSKGLQTNSSSRENGEIKSIGDNADTTTKPRPHSSVHAAVQNTLPRKPQAEGRKSHVEKRNRQKGPSLERVEGPVPTGEKVENQNLPMSTETQRGDLPAHGPADLLICQTDSILEQSIQHASKLDAMLKVLVKLNDTAKDLLVRSLITNNKLMMLNSPITEDKIQTIKASVMEALGTDGTDKKL